MESVQKVQQPKPSKEIEKITIPKKEKQPGRVAAGKRLAEWNKQKKLEKLQAAEQVAEIEVESSPPSTFDKYYLFLGVVGVGLSAIGLYYMRGSMHVCPLTQPAQLSKKVEKIVKPIQQQQKAVYEME